MRYLLRSVDSRRLDFQVEKFGFNLPILLLIPGLLLILIATYGFWSGYWLLEASSLGWLLLGIGGVLSSVALLMGRSGVRWPRRIRFDNDRACMTISQDNDWKNTADVPYREIREISFRANSVPGSKTIQRLVYDVILITVNLQIWHLGRFSSEEKAKAHAVYLSEMIELKKAGQPHNPEVPKSIRLENVGGKAILRWRNDDRGARALGILIFASLLPIVIFSFSQQEDMTWVFNIICGGIVLMEVFLIYSLLDNWNEIYRIEIDNKSFACFRERGLKLKVLRNMDLDDIRSIGSMFEVNQDDTRLLVVETGLFQVLEDVVSGKIGFMDAFHAFRKLGAALKLPAASLSTVERIRLSEMLRMLVRTAGGKNVI